MARGTRRIVAADANANVAGERPASEIGGDSNVSGDGFITIDPASITGDNGSGSGDNGSGGSAAGGDAPKRRGRRPGTTTKGKQAALDVNGLESLLYSVHGMLAGITKTEELMLDHSEAKSLAEATANVARHYDVSVSAKALDWSNLVMALGMVYGTRLVAIRARRGAERRAGRVSPMNSGEAADPFQGDTIVQFDPNFVPGA
jgi:hypothetical protein